jgi:type I restriction enzyme S subunit
VIEWHTTTLAQLVEEAGGFIKTGPFGSQLHAEEYVDDPSGVPVVMPKDMVRGKILDAEIKRVDELTAERLHGQEFPKRLVSANIRAHSQLEFFGGIREAMPSA